MAFKSGILFSIVAHATIVTIVLAFAAMDAASHVPESYVAVAVIEYRPEKKPEPAQRKNPVKSVQAARIRQELSSNTAFPAVDHEEISLPTSGEKAPNISSEGIVRDVAFAGAETAEATHVSVGPRPSRGTAHPSLSISAVSQEGQDGSRSGTGSRDTRMIGAIRAAIEKATDYPALARRRGIEGTVITGFRINNKGLPEGITVIKSSGYSLLDNAAKETVMKAAPLPSVKGDIEIPITFRLTRDK